MSKAISLADELNFTKPEELEEWLKDKPVEWTQVITVRTALRVLPLAGGVFHNKHLSLEEINQLIVLVFRSCFISQIANRYPSEDIVSFSNIFTDSQLAADPTDVTSRAAVFSADCTRAGAFATNNVDSPVGHAVAHAVIAVGVDHAIEFWGFISHDSNWLNSRPVNSSTAELLMNTRLWPDGEPDWMYDQRVELNRILIRQSKHHQVWINWYSNVLNGKSFFDLSAVREKELTLNIAKQENEFWERDFAKVSEDISDWLEQARIDDAKDAEQWQLDDEEQETASVPAISPATLQPEWHKGKLVLPSSPLDDDLKGASINAALSALKSDFTEFVTEIGNEANIDQRALTYLANITNDIPFAPPSQDKLFSLAHKEAFFTGYGSTVSEEWPEFLAARFHALGLQFSRVMQQFPDWREFKANADQKQFSSVEIENIEQLANLMEQGLREELAQDFVDQSIADIVADMAQQLAPADPHISPEQADVFIQSGKDLLAADLLTGLDNVVKRIVELMLVKLQSVASYSKEIAGLAMKGADKKLRENSEKLGEEVVDGVFKWGKRLFKISVGTTGTAVAGASAVGATPLGQWLVTNYPATFSWLEPILKLFV